MADIVTSWDPRWRMRSRGTGTLVVAWTVPVELQLNVGVNGAHDLRWLRAWLQGYLERQPAESEFDPHYSFIFVILGVTTGAEPDGSVDGTAVLEAGYGGPPAGPSEAACTTVDEMLTFAIDCLPG